MNLPKPALGKFNKTLGKSPKISLVKLFYIYILIILPKTLGELIKNKWIKALGELNKDILGNSPKTFIQFT